MSMQTIVAQPWPEVTPLHHGLGGPSRDPRLGSSVTVGAVNWRESSLARAGLPL